jgi:type I site-specific restriction-modification system R (restriction) subunit
MDKNNEKEIQRKINKFLEENITKKAIFEEEFKELNETEKILYQSHPYLLIPILKNNLKEINKSLIEKYSHNKNILDEILKDFIYKIKEIIYDQKKSNKDLFLLYTNKDFRQITLKDKDNKEQIEIYYIINETDFNQNEITIIKEKKIQEKNRKAEFPDFATYINGIPFICIEIKTLKAGYKEAVKDMNEKYSYNRFIYCIGTDTNITYITTDFDTKEPFIWINYNNNQKSELSFESLLLELLSTPASLLNYFYNYTLIDEDKLKNARVQQYFAAKKVINELKEKEQVFCYFKHHTRTGKSLTFKMILEYVKNNLNNKYKKIYILTHDLTVKNNLSKVLLNKNSVNYKEIKNKKDFQNSFKKTDHTVIYLTNIQKMESNLFNNKKIKEVKNSNEILFIIDENHTHQNILNGYAAVRNIMFPNASIVSATATPIIKITNNQKIDITQDIMGKRIDDFTPENALDAGIVLPCFFNYVAWKTELKDDTNLLNTVELLENKIQTNLIEKAKDIESFVQSFINNDIIKKIFKNKNVDIYSEIMNILEDNLDDLEEKYSIKNIEKIKELYFKFKDLSLKNMETEISNLLTSEIKRSLNFKKIDVIINHMKKLDFIYLNKKNNERFKPKAFLVVKSIEEGIKFILDIKRKILLDSTEIGEDFTNNIYKGIKFGLDVSKVKFDRQKFSREDLEFIEEYNIDERNINAKTVFDSIVKDFSSTIENSPQVLIIVNKHLMGFDLKELVTVFLDRHVLDKKVIMQLATRGATVRPGKTESYIVDLTLNKDLNKKVFEESFSIYNNSNSDSSGFLSEEEALNILKEVYEVLIPKFLKFFKIKDLKEFFKEDSIYKILNLMNKKEDNEEYFYLVSELNKKLKQTLLPSKFISYEDKKELKLFLEKIAQLNYNLIDIKIVYKLTEVEKRKIILDNINLLKLDINGLSDSIFSSKNPEERSLNINKEFIIAKEKEIQKRRLYNLKKIIVEKNLKDEINNILNSLEQENFTEEDLNIYKLEIKKLYDETISKLNNSVSKTFFYLKDLFSELFNKHNIKFEEEDLNNIINNINKIVDLNKEFDIETICSSVIDGNHTGMNLPIIICNENIHLLEENEDFIEELNNSVRIYFEEIYEDIDKILTAEKENA